MKYKVGDKVKIKSLDWYNANKAEDGEVYLESNTFLQLMSKYCGKVATITYACSCKYSLDIDGGKWNWIDEMFEENINDMETKEIIIPQGWEIDEVRGNKIILMESKKKLPETWEECYEQLGTENILPAGLGKPMLALMKLLVCREVYRQGWKPDWSDYKTKKWVIEYINDNIASMAYMQTSKVLSFQSAEIRDEFLENFRDLIEEAKELI